MLNPIWFVLSLWFNVGNIHQEPCPLDGITLTTQAQVDSFNIHYPGCTMIPEYLVISGGSSIKNLDSLYRITAVLGSFEITDCDSLKNIHGLRGLRSFNGSVNIANNPLLKDLKGLDSLVTINNYLSIHDNQALTSLNGLDAIDANSVSDLVIRDCPQLSVCNNSFVCNFLAIGGGSSVYGNAAGCANTVQIQKACDPGAICPSGSLRFKNKADIKEFFALYPNCHNIDGSVYLDYFEDYDSTSFLPFLQIRSIRDRLSLYSTYGIKNLHGFDSLTKIGLSLDITFLYDLKDLSGLENLKYSNNIYLYGNPVLTDIQALNHISPDSCNFLTLYNCTALSACNSTFVCNYLQQGESFISYNGPGCGSAFEISKNCFPELDCPPGDVTFHNQAELNEFKLIYPNCTRINGSLTVYPFDDSSITSLVPLKRIKSIGGDVRIRNFRNLTDLSGLDSLSVIGNSLFIENNPSFLSLHGLDSLKQIHHTLYIFDNTSLADISSLKSLDPNLVTNIIIQYNLLLSSCGIESICQYLHLNKQSVVTNNNGSCKSLVELKKSCGIFECATGGITFSTQEQVDRFPKDYPGCNIVGSLSILGADITNLDSLQQIKELRSGLYIYNCPVLKNISGLKNITKLKDYIDIEFNPVLENLDGLQSLTQMSGLLIIYFCPLLTSINGLSQLSPDHIEEMYIEYCYSLAVCSVPVICDFLNDPAHIAFIDYNAVGCNTRSQVRTSCGDVLCPMGDVFLTSQAEVDSFNLAYFDCSQIPGDLTITGSGIYNLDSLRNITTIGGQLIIQGTSINSLHGFENLDYTKLEGLILQSNDSLAVCELKPICDYLSIPTNSYTINDNASACNSFDAIQAECAKTCFYDGLTLTTQSEVDQFAINYPTCHIIPGVLTIRGTDITNVDSLYHLTKVGGSVIIDGTSLDNLKGLNALTSVGGSLTIRNNPLLTSIEDLNVADSLNSSLTIANNSSLPNLVGLEQLYKIGFQVSITSNPKLFSLDGLNVLTSIGTTLSIQSNTSLVDLRGLQNLTTIGNNFTLQSNAKLKTLQGLKSLTTVVGQFRIQGNSILDSISGLPVIHSIGRDLIIQSNPKLKNLNGLSSLTEFRRTLSIINNNMLADINGLRNITPAIITSLNIQNNSVLNVCHIQSICNYLSLPNKASNIFGNDTSCVSAAKVVESCAKISLAMEDVSLKIKQTNSKNILEWRTDATSDVIYFEPEYSQDGNQFKSIGIIKRTPSISEGYQFYKVDHTIEENGNYYYRLKLESEDQSISYTRIIRVNVHYFKPIIFPNPTTGEITISNIENNSTVHIEIKDMVGRSVKNVPYAKVQKLDIRHLDPGMYTIIISDKDNRWLEKIIKE